MEEELNEDELEERLYAMIHYADDTQTNVDTSTQNETTSNNSANSPRNTVRRYWRTSGDHTPINTHYQKVNNNSNTATTQQNISKTINKQNTLLQKVNTQQKPLSNSQNVSSSNKPITKPKEEKAEEPELPKQTVATDIALFFSTPLTGEIKSSIKILDIDEGHRVVELETSDEDEVVEVALPPKPIIAIESSDEDDICVVTPQEASKTKNQKSLTKENNQKNVTRPSEPDRDISASPVPSVVSSVSDDFIRGDCIALNISSRRPDKHDFDFSLHGSDLIETPTRKKKKKRNKDRDSSTPITNNVTPEKTVPKTSDECFATPKSKSKNKKQKSKSYVVTAVPNPDIYDSDSNQSFDISNKDKSYQVTEKSVPSIDVYESDSSQQSEINKTNNNALIENSNKSNIESTDSSISLIEKKTEKEPKKTPKVSDGATILAYAHKQLGKDLQLQPSNSDVVDLTDDITAVQNSSIEENIVMANVTGFEESDDYGDDGEDNQQKTQNPNLILGSTREPAILSADLDFDNVKGDAKVRKRRQFSLSTLRGEMDKFYNESWGGENFNHREIQKSMSRDKSLWEIDPKDKMPNYTNRRKVTCNYCNRVGHRDDTCRMKPPVCHMCGNVGHHEPRCPNKICVNCGSPNYMYSSVCRHCSSWARVSCAECNQVGHPASHCPDLWRRYHNTLSANEPLVETYKYRKHYQLFCSGCARRGHLVHTCRNSLPFSGLPINSPYVAKYVPLYQPTPDRYTGNTSRYGNQESYPENQSKRFPEDARMTPKSLEKNKRQSKSPTWHENHLNKKRHMSTGDIVDEPHKMDDTNSSNNQTEVTTESKGDVTPQKSKAVPENKTDDMQGNVESIPDSSGKALDFIPITSGNHDKMGQIIQDNEVSDTSEVVTSARIYVTNYIIEKLKSPEGVGWLNEQMQKHDVIVNHSGVNMFLNVKGKLVDQEAFQTELRDWSTHPYNKQPYATGTDSQQFEPQSSLIENIPKSRLNVVRKLTRALESLKDNLGDPKSLFNELSYLQENHAKLLKQKVISPQKLTNNRQHINEMLKKLNMVLLGQAGLADGSKHIRELNVLRDRLIHFRQKNLPMELRKEIGEHFHFIFTPTPRNDYKELVDRYYISRQSPKLGKNNRNHFPIQKKQSNSVPQVFNKVTPMPNPMGGHDDFIKMPQLPKPNNQMEKVTKNKLNFYWRRLSQIQPTDGVLKKTHKQLVRKLYTQMLALDNKSKMPAKSWKKIKKLQEQANQFLKNNV